MVKKTWAVATISITLLAWSIPQASAVEGEKAKTVQFGDINDHWAKANIELAVQKGYVNGYEDKTFRPELNVTRAEFVKMTATALKLSIASGETGTWYKPFVDAAIAKGLIKETDFPSDEYNQPISRMEMAKVALRTTDTAYQDVKAISNDLSMMYSAVKKGLIQGLAYGELAPDNSTTRAQSVTIVERILSVNAGKALEVDTAAVNNAELKMKGTNIFIVMPEIFGGDQLPDQKWSPDNLTVETPDGLYKGTMEQIIAIDLENPDDPNLYLLGDMDKLHWFNSLSYETSPLVKDGFMKSYILFFKGHVDYNKDTTIYNQGAKQPRFSVYGFTDNAKDLMKGKLSCPTYVFNNILGDIPAIIIPKTGNGIQRYVGIGISAPAIPPSPNFEKTLIQVLVHKD